MHRNPPTYCTARGSMYQLGHSYELQRASMSRGYTEHLKDMQGFYKLPFSEF